jgi:filamentous hemagglutinin
MRILLRLSCLIYGALISANVSAQIRADASAPADQRPTIHQTGNGVPLVNIQTPTAAGVSRNSYSQFDVSNQGAILNNSRTHTATQLGGWVDGNPWLATGSARVILNEVNSTNPSHLNGWIEVAGQSAQVVTANPAGITCNGCGFINTPQATLTTGTPTFDQAHITGYRIEGGQITIEGLGLDGRQADALTILTRSAAINAGLWAQRANLVTGTGQVTVDANGQPVDIQPIIISPLPQNLKTERAGSTNKDLAVPLFALDVTYLGGMYAGKIFLIGSEQGLGVNNAGALQAAEHLTLDSKGRLTNKGTMTAPELELKTVGAIDNQGLIAAQRRARIETASSLTNSGAARIYGEDIALQADTLINAGETIDGHTIAPVIAAQHHLAIGVETLDNRDSALILSGGDLSVGRHVQQISDPSTGRTRYTTTGRASRINNDSATIDVLGDVFIQAIALANRNTHLHIDQVPEAPFNVQRIQPAGSNTIYLSSQCRNRPGIFSSSLRLLCSAEGSRHFFEDYTLYNLTGTPSRSAVVSSKPAVFRVGGHLSLHGDGSAASQLTNQDSQIIAGGDIDFNDTALNNHETKGSYRIHYSGTAQYTTVETCGSFLNSSHCRHWHGQFAYNPAPEVTTIDLPTGQRYTANSTSTHVSGNGDAAGNNSTVPIPALPGAMDGANNALFSFTSHPESDGGYLIETDPRFANHRQWLSSDYLLDGLALDPALTQKRLGDGFYEQALVRDQVAELRGRRWLPGYADDEAQYLALMNNGKAYAEAFQLTPGIALSAEQMALLTTDLVWLVEQEVTLPDGQRTRVLAPKVYARVQPGDLDTNGTLIAGRSITVNLSGDVINSGLIAADQAVTINADDIHNLAGSIEGRDVTLAARVDINNVGGRFAATDSMTLYAGRDLNIQSTTQTTETALSKADAARGSQFTRTQIDRIARVYVTGTDKTNVNGDVDLTLGLSAGRNVTINAAQVHNTGPGQTRIIAGEHLTLATVTTAQDDYAVKNSKNHSHIAHREEVGTQLSTTGDLTLQAAQDLTLRAANVSSGGVIDVKAGNDARIEAGQAASLNDQARQTTKRSTFSRTTTTTRDVFEDTATLSTTVSGQRVSVTAGNNVTVEGSNVVADDDVTINAGRDLQIVAGTNTHTEDHYRHQKKSGVFGSGGAGITVGKRTQSTDQQTTRTTSSASTIGSLGGDIDLQAGRTYTQTGSDVIALGQSNSQNNAPNNTDTVNATETNISGNATIIAEQVNITEARETRQTETETRFKQSGVTVAVSAPVITAIQTVDQMATAAGNTDDPRMKALAAANVVMAVDQAVDAVKRNPEQLGGVSLSISVGSSKAQSQSTLTTDTSAPSRVIAANDIAITATDQALANAGSASVISASSTADEVPGIRKDLTVQGSQIKASNTVTLQADDQIKVLAARDTAEQHSTNSNQSASVGVSFAVGTQQTGVSLNVAASRGRGYADGSDVHWVNSEVSAGQRIQTESGTDTTIRGGVLSAPQVMVKVGTRGQGDLTIESLQDTGVYDSEQQQRGASLSVPVAGKGSVSGSLSAADSRINSDYASVVQQSGIRAGDGGFQVSVNGDTTLTGGGVTSTQIAIDEKRNTLETEGTLTTTDINNRAVYDAKSVGIQLGAGYSPSGKLVPQGTGAGVGTHGDAQYSTTQAAISSIAGNKDARTDDTETGLVNKFDAAKVQQEINAQVQITQSFGQQAGKRLADYTQQQRTILYEQLKNAPDETERRVIQAQINDLNIQERALNVMIGGVTGFGGVMLLKESLSVAADQMRQLMIEDSKKFKGVTDGKTVLSNVSGTSHGVRGDGVKVGGTRVDLDLLCGPVNERCVTNPEGNLAADPKGNITFTAGSFEAFMETPDGKKMIGPTGGVQGAKGKLFGVDYEAGSWQDQMIEAFSGTHDMIGGKLTGLYDDQGNAKRGMLKIESGAYDAWAGVAIVPAAPFAFSEILSPEVWKALSIVLDSAK